MKRKSLFPLFARITIVLIVLFCFSISCVFSQEGEDALKVNSSLYYQHQNRIKNTPPQKKIDFSYRFLIDTLSIPFEDDFSINRIKNFSTEAINPAFIDSVVLSFKVNGVYADSLEYMSDTTWYYVTNTSTMQKDSFPNPQYEVIFYTNQNPTETLYVWPNFSTDSSGSTLDTIIYFTPDSVLYNQSNTFYTIPDDSISLWTGAGVFINATYPVNPPTIGVATFDGVDSTGMPYNFTHENSYGVADILTSKPIFLKYNPSDSVYLSFFYQSGGKGNVPDDNDSLLLEVYSPTDTTWNKIWETSGVPLQEFQQVMLPITDSKYLQNGFQFRFKNYATLSGNLDHWHIDYVRLNKSRNLHDTLIDDVAFIYNAPSFIKDYTSIPWKHYVQFPDDFMKDTIVMDIVNLSDFNKLVNVQYTVFNDTLVFNSEIINDTKAPKMTTFTKTHSIKTTPNYFRFPTKNDSNERKSFSIIHTARTTPDANRFNDTIHSKQIFDTYYAYDDGIAEKAYYISGYGAKVACEFSLHDSITDTLRAVYIHFPPMFTNITTKFIKLSVWSSLYPEKRIYFQLIQPQYGNELNGFHRYALDSGIIVSKKFYIGWEVIGNDKIYVGIDKNIDNHTKMFSNYNGSWNNIPLEGTLLVHPDFGTPIVSTSIDEAFHPQFDFTVYPNPADKNIIIVLSPMLLSNTETTVSIYDITGKEAYTDTFLYSEAISIDVSQYPKGIYLCNIRSVSSSQYQQTKKIIVLH